LPGKGGQYDHAEIINLGNAVSYTTSGMTGDTPQSTGVRIITTRIQANGPLQAGYIIEESPPTLTIDQTVNAASHGCVDARVFADDAAIRLATVQIVNHGPAGEIRVSETPAGGDLAVTLLTQSHASGVGNTWAMTEDGTLTVAGGSAGVDIRGSGSVTLFADGADGSQLMIRDSIRTTTGQIILRADQDVRADNADRMVGTADLALFRNALGKHTGQAGHLDYFDHSADGVIDSAVDDAEFLISCSRTRSATARQAVHRARRRAWAWAGRRPYAAPAGHS